MLFAIDESHLDRLVVDYPYFQRDEPLIFEDAGTYVETDVQFSTMSPMSGTTVSANHHGSLDAGMELTGLAEHDSVRGRRYLVRCAWTPPVSGGCETGLGDSLQATRCRPANAEPSGNLNLRALCQAVC